MKYYKKVEKFALDAYENGEGKGGLTHYKRTVYWVKQLRPNADEALLIAAICHDIERAFRDEKTKSDIKETKKSFMDKDKLTRHQEKGAEIAGKYLIKLGADKHLIERVKHLISKHEVGGDKDQNLLKDADSVSFFENNVDYFVTKQAQLRGKENVREKFQWMYQRISSPKAKAIVKGWYEEALEKLKA